MPSADCCADWYAQSSSSSPEVEQKLTEPWMRLAQNHTIPPLDEASEYKVYILRSENFSGHMSIVFSYQYKVFIAVNIVSGDSKEVIVYSEVLRNDLISKLAFCQDITTSPYHIFEVARKTRDAFCRRSGYSMVSNNCQQYGTDLLKNLRVEHLPPPDMDYNASGSIRSSFGPTTTILFGILLFAAVAYVITRK